MTSRSRLRATDEPSKADAAFHAVQEIYRRGLHADSFDKPLLRFVDVVEEPL